MNILFALLQTISAFVIFVLGYLVLMLFVVVCFAIAACVYKGGCLARAYTVRSASLDHGAVISQVDNETDPTSRVRTVLR